MSRLNRVFPSLARVQVIFLLFGAMSLAYSVDATPPSKHGDYSFTDCGNTITCACNWACSKITGICGLIWTGDPECIARMGGKNGPSPKGCPPSRKGGSFILQTRYEHIHDAIDYQPVVGIPQGPGGCLPCAAGGSQFLPSAGNLPQVMVSRLHRYRNQTMRSRWGKGVYGWWDTWVVLNRTNSDGSGTFQLQTPTQMNQSMVFTTTAGANGRYTPASATLAYAQLLDANRQPVTDQFLATTVVVEDAQGTQMEFEIINFSTSNTVTNRDCRLIVVRDPYSWPITLNYRFAATATTASMSNNRGHLIDLSTISDPLSHQLQFQVNTDCTIASITTPIGGVLTYTYANGFLTGVHHPDGSNTTVSFQVVAAENSQIVSYDDPTAVDGGIHRRKNAYLSLATWVDPADPTHVVPQSVGTLRRIVAGSPTVAETTYRVWPRSTNSNDWLDNLVYLGGNELMRILLANHCGIEQEGYAANYHYGDDINAQTFAYETLTYFPTNMQPGQWMDGRGQIATRTLTPNGVDTSTVTFRDGTMLTLAYDGNRQVTDESLTQQGTTRTTHYTYDTLRHLTSKTEAFGTSVARTSTWTFDANSHLLTAEIDNLGRATEYQYNGQKQVIAILQPADQVGGPRPTTSFVYDSYGRMQSVTDPDGVIRTFTWNSSNQLLRTTYADASYEAYTYDTTGLDAGLLRTATDRNAIQTQFSYDALGRKTQVVRAFGRPEAEVSTWQYLVGTDIVSRQVIAGDVTEYNFDAQNRINEVRHIPRVGATLAEHYAFDENGERYEVTDSYGRSQVSQMDAGDRPVRQVQEFIPGVVLSDTRAAAVWDAGHPAPTIDTTWTGANVGSGTPSGSATLNSGVWTVVGNGVEMWNDSDAFYLNSRTLPENGTITLRLTSQENTNAWAKAGLMVRGSTAANAPYAAIMWSPNYGVSVNTRMFTGANSRYNDMKMRPNPDGSAGPFLPVYFQITRHGFVMDLAYCFDGVTWNPVAQVTLGVAPTAPVLAGMFVLSHTTGSCQAVFDQVAVTTERYQPTRAEQYRWLTASLTRSQEPEAAITDLSYGFLLELAQNTDPLGVVSSFAYDAIGQLTCQTEAVGTAVAATTAFTYDGVGNRLSVTSPRGVVTTTTYTQRDLIATLTEAAGSAESAVVSTRTYTLSGRFATDTDALGRVTTNVYGGCCQRLTQVVDPAGFITAFTYDFAGNRLTVTDSNNLTTATAYDGRRRPTTVTNAAGEVTSMVYDDSLTDGVGLDAIAVVQSAIAGIGLGLDADGSAIAVTNPKGETAYELRDGLGRSVARIDPLGHITRMTYDTLVSGLVETAQTDPLGHVTRGRSDGAGRTRIQVDALGSLAQAMFTADGDQVSQLDAAGLGWTAIYDERHRLTSRTSTRTDVSETTSWTYDLDGNRLTETDALGKTEVSQFDLRNRRILLTDRLNGLTRFSYDAVGNPLTISDAENESRGGFSNLAGTTQYAYNIRNLLIAESFPTGQGGRTLRTYGYDAGRRLTARNVGVLSGSFSATPAFSGSAETTSYNYDAANRLTTRGYADSKNDTFSYDLASRLTVAVSARYATAVGRVYDADGRLTSESLTLPDGSLNGTTVSPATYSVGYSYDNANRTTGIMYPTGTQVVRTYTDRNELATVSLGGSTVATRTYDVSGRLTSTVSGNGVTETRTYVNGSPRVASIAAIPPIGPAATGFSYSYDATGRKMAENDSIVQNQAFNQAFNYDFTGRLIDWKRGPTATPTSTQTWNLSLVGDWNSTTRDGVAETRQNTWVHEAVQVGTNLLTYDVKGNLTKDERQTTLAWDPENRLTAALVTPDASTTGFGARAVYRYDALGRRVAKTVQSQRTLFLNAGAQTVVELEQAAVPTQAQVNGAESDGTVSNAALTPASGGVLTGAVTRINFQPATTVVPAGFFGDSGKTFPASGQVPRTNGLAYGWTTDATAQAVERHGAVPLVEYDTFIQAQSGLANNSWMMALPNGSYPVIVVAGDALSTDQTNNLVIGGVAVTDATPATSTPGYEAGNFDGYAVQVTVTNGILTIAPGTGAIRAKICFIEIGAIGTTIDAATTAKLTAMIARANAQTGANTEPISKTREYIYGTYVDEVLAFTSTVANQTKVNYVHSNHLYSVAALTDAAGKVVERYSYDAYGKQTVRSATGNVIAKSSVGYDRGFTGYRKDDETGLLHANARYYDPGLGRFVSRDPLSQKPSQRTCPFESASSCGCKQGADLITKVKQRMDVAAYYGPGYDLYQAYMVPNATDPTGNEPCSQCAWYLLLDNDQAGFDRCMKSCTPDPVPPKGGGGGKKGGGSGGGGSGGGGSGGGSGGADKPCPCTQEEITAAQEECQSAKDDTIMSGLLMLGACGTGAVQAGIDPAADVACFLAWVQWQKDLAKAEKICKKKCCKGGPCSN